MSKGQMDIESNVILTVRDATFNEVKTVHKRNRVTNRALYGVARLLFGLTNEMEEFVPRYIAFGTGTVTGSSAPNPTDTGLSNEITDNESNTVRIPITQRNIINSNLNNGVVKVAFRAYTASGVFTNITLTEMGLFIEETGNNLFARVGLGEGVTKGETDVLDVLWEINIRSTTTEEVTNEL